MTIKQIMAELGITDTYDTAIPQDWLNTQVNAGFQYADIYGNYVWLYDAQAKVFGRPFNVMAAYARHLINKIENNELIPVAELNNG